MIELSPKNGWVSYDDFGYLRPWYTSGVLEILDKMDLKDKRIFEYGAGNSTVWFRSRGATVEGVDSDITWATFAKVDHEIEYTKYLNAIYKHDPFDIVCIDGDPTEWRDDCTVHAIGCLNQGGIIIIDNFDQPSVPPNEWFRTRDIIASRSLKYKAFRQEKHSDWQSIIIYT